MEPCKWKQLLALAVSFLVSWLHLPGMPHRLRHPDILHLQCYRHSCDWSKMKMKFNIYVKSKGTLISHNCSLGNNCDSHSLVSIGCFLNRIAECEMIMDWNTAWMYNLEAIHCFKSAVSPFFYNFSFTPLMYMPLPSIQYADLWNLDYTFIHVYISSNLSPNMLFIIVNNSTNISWSQK